MTKPVWEEEWSGPGEGFSPVVETPLFDFAIRSEGMWRPNVLTSSMKAAYRLAVARLASAAPDMARVLLDVEWIKDGVGYHRCPSCHRDDGEGHADACRLYAALRKAGVR